VGLAGVGGWWCAASPTWVSPRGFSRAMLAGLLHSALSKSSKAMPYQQRIADERSMDAKR
jgi:hypothetical protein